jgi:hypothetical protein
MTRETLWLPKPLHALKKNICFQNPFQENSISRWPQARGREEEADVGF